MDREKLLKKKTWIYKQKCKTLCRDKAKKGLLIQNRFTQSWHNRESNQWQGRGDKTDIMTKYSWQCKQNITEGHTYSTFVNSLPKGSSPRKAFIDLLSGLISWIMKEKNSFRKQQNVEIWPDREVGIYLKLYI